MKTTNSFITSADFPTIWEETPDGFLRVKARTLKEGVMPYARHELTDIPPELDGIDPIMMLVPMDAMCSGETLRSLEGARVTAPEHEWVTPDNAVISKGSSAGAARIEGPFHVTDLLITDSSTIEGIKSRNLGEISGGYNAECQYGVGEWNGQQYHAKQTNITYNHIAILKPGEGRGGTEVRIMNQKVENVDKLDYRIEEKDGKFLVKVVSNGPKDSIIYRALTKSDAEKWIERATGKFHNQGENVMSVKVQLKNTGKFINTDEEGAAAIAEESQAGDEFNEGFAETSGKKLQKLMDEVEQLNAQIAELTAQAEEGKGELSVYKEKLDELLSDEAAEAQAEGMVEESAEADEIIENACSNTKQKEEIRNSIGRIGNTGIYKLRGVALQTAVLNSVGMKTENMSPAEIRGAFKAQHHMSVTNKGKAGFGRTVAGAKTFTNDNTSVTDHKQGIINKMWGKK